MNLFKKIFRKKEYLVSEITQVLNDKQIVVDKGYSDGIRINTEIIFYKKHESNVEEINPYLEYNGSGEILQLENTFTVIFPYPYKLNTGAFLLRNSFPEVGDIVKFKI